MGSEGVPRGVHESSADMLRDIYVRKVQDRLESFQQKIIEDVKMKMEAIIDDVVKDLKTYEVTTENKALLSEEPESVSGPAMKKKPADVERSSKLPDKIFIPRNSLLTDLFEVKHIKSIYNIFIVMLSLLFMNTLLHDFVVEGRINLGFRTIKLGFANFDRALIIWCVMQLAVFALYYAFRAWAAFRFSVRKNIPVRNAFNMICFVLLVASYLTLVISVTRNVILHELGFASTICVEIELLRMLMKVHAFVTLNFRRQKDLPKSKLSQARERSGHTRERESERQVPVPCFSKFWYFMLAPTLVYRDWYPRTLSINWKFVFENLLDMVGVVFFVAMLHEHFLLPNFETFGAITRTPLELILSLFQVIIPSAVIFLSIFFCILHCWLNAMAEMLTFADRLFYKDWWNAVDFRDFYRNWNIVVFDWINEYVYRKYHAGYFKLPDLKIVACVSILTAVIVEFIISVSVGFFYPVFLVLFLTYGIVLSVFIKMLPRAMANMFLWWALFTGFGVLTAIYCAEFYARKNCDIIKSGWNNFTEPISWSCHSLVPDVLGNIKLPWEWDEEEEKVKYYFG